MFPFVDTWGIYDGSGVSVRPLDFALATGDESAASRLRRARSIRTTSIGTGVAGVGLVATGLGLAMSCLDGGGACNDDQHPIALPVGIAGQGILVVSLISVVRSSIRLRLPGRTWSTQQADTLIDTHNVELREALRLEATDTDGIDLRR